MKPSKQLVFKGNYQLPESEKRVEVTLSLLQFEQDQVVHIYAPALDLFGYGHSLEEAEKSFDIVLEEFFRYTLHKKTLRPELERLGWKIGKKKISAPVLSDMIKSNAELKKIVDKRFPVMTNRLITIPAHQYA
jgi:hypothetical protein